MVNVAESHGDYFAESVGRDAVRYHILYKYAASHETFTSLACWYESLDPKQQYLFQHSELDEKRKKRKQLTPLPDDLCAAIKYMSKKERKILCAKKRK